MGDAMKIFKTIMIIGAMNFVNIAPPITSIESAIERLVYVGIAFLVIYMVED